MASYTSILKSSGLIGLVQICQLTFGIIRNKVVAIVLGASGFGIWGLYQTYLEMVSSFSSLGIDQSGVREIAKNHDDHDHQLKVILILKRSLLLICVLVTLLSICFSKTISKSLFDTEDYFTGVILVSFVIIFNTISKGQKAILNGLRNIRGLAISQIYGSISGTILTISLVFFLGVKGIPLYLFGIGLMAMLFTWLQVRKLKLEVVTPSKSVVQSEFKNLLYLGLGFSISAIISGIFSYLSRIYLNSAFDLSTVGIYQASWTISNMYIGIILTAMGVDFMPRMMELVSDNKKLNNLVNEQMELGLLISSIGVVFILIFSSFILQILYSSEFIQGSQIIRWQVLGVALRVLGFPFSYSIMAKNKPVKYVMVQAVHFICDYLLLIFFSKLLGFEGLGINYFISYIIYLGMTWFICYKLFDFSPTALLMKITLISFTCICCGWFISYFFSGFTLVGIGVLLLIGMAIWINLYLSKYMGANIIGFIKNKLKK
ncbi:MAG: O-antigen translocase [Leeuwenhoekiella sp.]